MAKVEILNENPITRLAPETKYGREEITTQKLANVEFDTDEIIGIYHGERKHVRLSHFIDILTQMKEKFGDGYITNGSSEWTDEINGISIYKEKIDNRKENVFYSID